MKRAGRPRFAAQGGPRQTLKSWESIGNANEKGVVGRKCALGTAPPMPTQSGTLNAVNILDLATPTAPHLWWQQPSKDYNHGNDGNTIRSLWEPRAPGASARTARKHMEPARPY